MASIQRLSTPEIIRLSRDVFNKLSSQHQTELSTVHQFLDSGQFDLLDSEIKDVELAVLLIASAHEASNNHFDNTTRLLNLCGFLSSYKGNKVQRMVHYFTKALQKRIAREVSVIPSESEGKQLLYPSAEKALDSDLIACWLKIPFIQISQFAAIQVVIDSLASAKRVHLIALSIRSGVHCPVLMQALANRHEFPVEFLKITAVRISETEKKTVEIGKSLTCLAETLNLPFSFCSIGIADIEKESFGICEDEVVAVLSLNVLRNIRVLPDFWTSFPRFLMNLHPCVLVVVEPEEIYDSLLFIDHFHKALLSYSSFYDCIEVFLNKENRNRILLEAIMGQEVEHVLAAKDEEIFNRNTNINIWRGYFTGLGMVETEVSLSSFDQANLLVKNSASEESSLLERNGKCLMAGWKGTSYLSVSAWKFKHENSKAGHVGRKVT